MRRIAQSPTDPAFVQDPYPFYDRARALGGIVHWDDYALPVATTHAAVLAILKDRRMGRTPLAPPAIPPHLEPFHAVEAHSMLELEPPRHTRLRGLVLRAFTSRRIAALAPEIETLCHALIDRFPTGETDLLPAYCRPLPVIVIARLLGVPETMADQLLAWSNAMVAMYQAGRSRPQEDAAATAAADFAAYLRDHAARRRATPGDDLITHLLAAEEDGRRLGTDELVSTCILLLNAGHEATVHTLGNGIRALLASGTRPDGAATVEEILRYDPPLHLFTRHVYEDVEIAGHALPRGTEIGCLLGAANRDPAAFPDPDRFDPARAPHPHANRPHAAFGAGLHFCVGAPLARLEIDIALRTLFRRRPDLALAAPPRYADLYHFRGLDALRVA